ncbi:hypothetical protein BLNAU_1225 [Blattamonas nauphoetae]|uniref:Uncharacterized protein n=1 Tax=Blattamonas nauphoetae TaxID=2049346 RepID=A0ABQ9YIV5_9EUKA|nr:hypothetical protein BLNAU_1225 [Blattamonas nauphoetae]
MSRSMNTPLSFATTLALLVSGRQTSIDGWMVTIGGSFRSEGSEDVIAEFMAVLDSCSVATHTLPLPSATPSPPTPSLCLCLSLTTHTLPLSSASPSPRTPSHSPLPLPHHPHPPTPLCLSLTTHTLPLSSASPSPRTPSHSPLPLPHHPHPPTPLCLSVTTHTISLPCASPSPPTRSNLLFIFVLTTFLCIPWREIITVATMEMVKALTMWCSSRDQYALVQADLIPQLIITLSAQSLPVADAVDIHTSLLNIIVDSLWLSTPRSLAFLGNQDENGQQHVHETIMKQVVAPSEKSFLELIARILRISPYYQQTMDFILGLPSRSMNTPLSFATTLALLVSGRQTSIDGWMVTIGGSFRSEGSEDVIAEFMAVLDSCSVATHTLPLPSATPSPPTPSLCLCLSLTTHTLPLSSASPSPRTPSHSPLPLPHHPHPPTPLCLSLTTHTLPLSSASPSPRTPSHSPLPLPHHPHPPTPLCLSVTTHTISLPVPLPHRQLSIVVLVSSPSRIITVATMEMVKALTMWCSSRDQYALVQADLIPQLIITLSAQSLPVADAVDIHTSLLNIIVDSLWLSTPRSLAFLGNQDENGQQHVHETIMKQVVAPSEKSFLELIARILRISPYYQQTMDFILGLPVFLTVPCCLTFFEYDGSIWCFLHTMNHARWEWNKGRGEVRQMWKKVLQMLRMEGIEDVIEEKLEIDRNGTKGREIVIFSIDWNNLQGMNLSERE